MQVVAGIDIGGVKKGCNVVFLQGNSILDSCKSKKPEHLLALCLEFGAVAVGIDAPCQWRSGAAPRLAERELARERITSFSTPTYEGALNNAKGYYGWMFNGEDVYRALSSTYPLLRESCYSSGRASFETYPHAITCALLGREVASAKQKRVQRRRLLEDKMNIDTTKLRSIDAVDAALCALTARFLLEGRTHAYGDALGGYLHVPVVHPEAAPARVSQDVVIPFKARRDR
ncbi:DUF429 domain-containing protein [Burkholderia pseudomallei]|uniref:DUF429 domain-containing protein n=1 Tax=Burkholderia pseudomallei TaxID=28450 RepID=UPI0005376CE3|nr:DUF429 domain-containing protein [Burkholderia pseudomallei]KGW85293.1 hypothetical protein Y030_2317 [Burkholderia pseudomallei MSHR332]